MEEECIHLRYPGGGIRQLDGHTEPQSTASLALGVVAFHGLEDVFVIRYVIRNGQESTSHLCQYGCGASSQLGE